MSELRFASPAPASTELVFGASSERPPPVALQLVGVLPPPKALLRLIPATDLAVIGALPALRLLMGVTPSVPLVWAGALPALALAAETHYISRAQRPTVGQAHLPWGLAQKAQHGPGQPHQDARSCPTGWRAHWQPARAQPEPRVQHQPPVLVAEWVAQGAGFQDGRPLPRATVGRQADTRRLGQQRSTAHRDAQPLRARTDFRHQDGTRSRSDHHRTRWQNATAMPLWFVDGMQAATPWTLAWLLRYQQARPPPPGIRRPVVPPPPPGTRCYTPSAALVFDLPRASGTLAGSLRLRCDADWDDPGHRPVVVAVRRIYLVLNDVSLRRVVDDAVVPAFNLALSLDAASWTWGFEASLPLTAQALVEPDEGPVELLASVNGAVFHLLAEQIRRERQFGQGQIRVTGRGRQAFLDAPYAAVQTFTNGDERTSQQLMDDVLTLNGIPLGWSIDWGLQAWNVPAGVFSHQGTYLSALVLIAQAGGGYLIPERQLQGFKVRHRYPSAPWDWGSVVPDFVLPADVVSRESLAWVEKPVYNRVFVGGQGQGVLGQVTRAGTAGELLAPMVVDPLITTASAARQRGLAILADTGRQIEVGLRLPVLPEIGVIEPGAFVQYDDGGLQRLGLVRSVSLEVGMPEVWQTLGVETRA